MENCTFNFDAEKLGKCSPKNKNPQALFAALADVLPRYEINTPERVAAFLAQCGHESADFTVLKENLNYSAAGLRNTWPTRFLTEDDAQPYHRNPEKIANKVYANRLGNGAEESGDGWKFRGRGAIQTTGKSNYQVFANKIGKTLDETVSYIETLEGAVESAAFYWERNQLNELADTQNIKEMTRRINGGFIGLAERQANMTRNMQVLGE